MESFSLIDMHEKMYFNKKFLFSWEEIPGKDSLILIDYLKKMYGVDWEKAKIDKGKTIKVTTEKNHFS